MSVRLVDEVAEAEVRRKKKEVKAERKQKREEKTEREMVRAIRNVVYEILVVYCAAVCVDSMDAAGTAGAFLSYRSAVVFALSASKCLRVRCVELCANCSYVPPKVVGADGFYVFVRGVERVTAATLFLLFLDFVFRLFFFVFFRAL